MSLLLYLSAVVLATAFLVPGPVRAGLTGTEAASWALLLIGIYLVAALRLVLRPPRAGTPGRYRGTGGTNE